MKLQKRFRLLVMAIACTAGQVHAGVIEFTDKAEWEAAGGAFTTIDFTGFPEFTLITDQYQDLGVTFTDGNDVTRFMPFAFPNDSWGLKGNGEIHLSFATPQSWIGLDFPGFLRIFLFSNDKLVFFSSIFAPPGGIGGFGGLVSNELFDSAILTDPGDDLVFIDDLHFGVPAPGALWVFALAGIWKRSRRRVRD